VDTKRFRIVGVYYSDSIGGEILVSTVSIKDLTLLKGAIGVRPYSSHVKLIA
jgi:hypothetical protein